MGEWENTNKDDSRAGSTNRLWNVFGAGKLRGLRIKYMVEARSMNYPVSVLPDISPCSASFLLEDGRVHFHAKGALRGKKPRSQAQAVQKPTGVVEAGYLSLGELADRRWTG